MKNFVLFLLMLAFATNLSGQIRKGSVLIGGTVGVNNINEDGSGATIFNVTPQAGFFLSNRFVLGGNLAFTLVASEGSSAASLGLGPFVRYYFNDSGTARFFGQLDMGLSLPDLEEIAAAQYWSGGINVGVDFFLNNNVAIEALLGYSRSQDFNTEAGFNRIGFNFGVVAFIGGNNE